MTTNKLTRVALVGLSAKPTGFGWINNVHLPYILAHPDLEIGGILASSKAAGDAAIVACQLKPTVRAYGSAEELAADSSIDLVVVGVRADKHRSVIMPSLQAGKDFLVEWPIDITFEKSQEIVELARLKGLRSAVDLQGSFARIIRRVTDVVRSGRIGRVLSISVSGGVPTGGPEPEPDGLKYSLSEDSGATIVDIHLAHIFECIICVGGGVRGVNSLIKTMRPNTDLINPDTGDILERNVLKSAPDQILVHGEFLNGGVLNIHLHGGVGIGGAAWNVIGEKGQIVITGAAMVPFINTSHPWKMKVQQGNEVTDEEVLEEEAGKQLAVYRLWDAYLKGNTGTWPDFDHALSIQKIIKAIKTSNQEKNFVLV